jgi:hypothetical protein
MAPSGSFFDVLFNLIDQPLFDLFALICLSSVALIVIHVVRSRRLTKIEKQVQEAQYQRNILH